MRIKRILAPALLIVLTGAILIQLPIAIADRASAYEWFNPIIDIRDVLLRRSVIEPDEQKMQRAMIEAMIESLDDPHTVFIPPERRADFEKDLRGTYVGIGAEVSVEDGYLTIVSPMDGSPALDAGILAGDVILEIDGESTHREPIAESIARLMGKPGTTVTVLVQHLDGTEEEITIVRGHIVTRTVRGLRRDGEQWNHCLDDSLGVFYVRLTQFHETTRGELAETLERLNRRGLNGLVLDLRDNPGGSLPAAVNVADLFLESGEIVSVRGREGQERSFTAGAPGTLPQFPMIVLVNGASASASEIVAGAVQENGRAKVLGTRTFGKGSVQEVRELPFDQGMVKYTAAHHHLPSGRNIQRRPDSAVWGVDPDPGFVLPVPDDQYIAMVRARREYEIIREADPDAPDCVAAEWIREHLQDEQLAAAVEAVSARLRGEQWPRPGGEDPAHVAFEQEMQRITDERQRMVERVQRLEQRMGELRDLAAEAGREPLVPPDVDLAGGTITVTDRHGNLIGTYRIEGGDVDLALQSVRLRPVEE